jgi:17beta-estradiol 17-dehydrogenase / very-long-chain 3-oxoacyl-CoA reductase
MVLKSLFSKLRRPSMPIPPILENYIENVKSYPWDQFFSYQTFLAFFYLAILYSLYKLQNFIYKNCVRKRVNMIGRYGDRSWALVTGATDGIGKAFCEELALIGFNIILVSRNPEKLNKVAKEIQNLNPNIQTHEVEFDFDKRTGLDDYLQVFGEMNRNFEVRIVVNNVGTDFHKPWNGFTAEETFRLINLNMKPQTMITKVFLENFLKKQGHCAFINLSSFCSDFPFPCKAVYSSTKIFNHYLTLALREEFSNSNIDFLSFKPLGVKTLITPKPADGISILYPRPCVRSCLDDLVYESETYGHWLHKIQAVLINIIPGFIMFPFLRNLWYSHVVGVVEDKNNLKMD